VAGRTLDDDDAGAGFARRQRGTQTGVAAAEHCDVVGLRLGVNGGHGRQL